MANEFTSDGKFIFINTPYAEAYIPDDLMNGAEDDIRESSVAYDTGEYVVSIGIFYMRFFEDENQDRESVPVRTVCYPNKIEMHPSGDGGKKETLTFNGESNVYRVYKFYKGDQFMEAASKKSYLNTDMVTRLILSGNTPRSLSYDDIFFVWLKSFQLNDVSTGIPPALMQAMVAKMCRDANDPSVQFRMIAGKKKVDPRSYRALSLNQVSAYSSVMSSMAFERFSEKLTTSLNMTKENIPQEPSPIEKLLTM